jgi:hypothetical protein
MPNQSRRARAAFAFGVEFGLERFGKLSPPLDTILVFMQLRRLNTDGSGSVWPAVAIRGKKGIVLKSTF